MAPHPEEKIRFEPDDPNVALMMRTGEMPVRHVQRFRHVWYVERGYAAVYSPVCEGACTTELGAGEYHLALSKDGGRSVPAGAVSLNGPATIHGEYQDRSGLRIAGDVILIGGIIGGVVMIVASADSQTCDPNGDFCTTNVNGAVLGGGIAVVVASAVVGSILASQRDTASVSVTPFTLPSVGALKETPMAAFNAGPPPQGAALTVKF